MNIQLEKYFKKSLFQSIAGWLILLIMWFLFSNLEIISPHVLPSPEKTWKSAGDLYRDHNLFGERIFYKGTQDTNVFATIFSFFSSNFLFSVKINMAGYICSILLALPFGFIIGLFEWPKKLFNQQINALRFVPITALGGIFIALSGLTIWTKINFLAFGIWVYLVPVIIQRINEISNTHKQMMITLGASKWQTFKYLQWKYVITRLSDDIRILVGISWTYIIVAELKNIQGGLGSLIFLGERQSNPGYVYVAIIIIVAFGVFQDRSFQYIDKKIFPSKYA